VERLNGTLQENLITLLAHSDEYGKVIARLIEPVLYEGEYRTIAERCVDYWAKYNQAPGPHTADLFHEILEDPNNRRASSLKRTLRMMADLAPSVNAKYVLQEARTFKRGVQLKSAILQSAEKINSKQEHAIGEIEELWNGILRARDVVFDPGMGLGDYDRVLDYLARKSSEFTTGVRLLDEHGIVPYRGALMIFVAAAKRGKSWWLVNLGKRAFLQRKKVVHISLEMSEEEVCQRYYQALFSITKREAHMMVTRQKVKDDQLIGLVPGQATPEFYFDSPDVRMELEARLEHFDQRLDSIKIKRFPPRGLTPNQLRGYLDNLELSTGFIPDLLILDYAGIMKTDVKNHRIELGRNVEELRAIGVERNIAVATAHQSSREGAKSQSIKSTHVAEDWSVIQTADIILTFSATENEKKLGLGRLYVANARDEEDEWGVIISQALSMGQFVLGPSAYLKKEYWKFIKEEEGEDGEEDGAE